MWYPDKNYYNFCKSISVIKVDFIVIKQNLPMKSIFYFLGVKNDKYYNKKA